MARRLRRAAPDTSLVGGFFTLDPKAARDRDLVETIPVDDVAYSLRDVLSYCQQLAKRADPELVALSPLTGAELTQPMRVAVDGSVSTPSTAARLTKSALQSKIVREK